MSSTPPTSILPPTLCTLPQETLTAIGLALRCREFGRFLQTSRHVHDTLDTHWIWHQRFVNRFGQTFLKVKLKQIEQNAPTVLSISEEEAQSNTNLSQTSEATKEQLIEWYRQYENSISEFGEVAHLRQVFWLDVSANFYGVPQGRYYVQWGLIVKSLSSVLSVLFRAVIIRGHEIPAWDNQHLDTIGFTAIDARSFVKETNSPFRDQFQPGYMILQLPDVLEVSDNHPTVFVQIKNHNDLTPKYNLDVDYVRLVEVDDSSKAFDPLPLDPNWRG
ncbi:hypothetical protein FBU30_006258 [Linnemannia zychae]|nr:hypothetical protein FBU30_006258 [Linnemannia zychae]